MSNITVKFVEFWPTFDIHHNVFVDALSTRHNVSVIDDSSFNTPDLLFYSRFITSGDNHYEYNNCIKIYFTGENDIPDFNECDYALSFHQISFGPRHMRFPLYLLYEYNQALNPPEISDADAINRGFCSVVLRNDKDCDPMRLKIIDAAESYKPLAYGGRFRNNVGGCVENKIEFLQNYKFNLALENSMVPGYVTEKIVEPLAAPSLPIYWGSDLAKTDFNPEAFINVSDYATLDSLLREIEYLDTNDEAYLAMLRAPRLNTDYDFVGRLADFLDNIVTTRQTFVIPYAESAMRNRRNQLMLPLYSNRLVRYIASISHRIIHHRRQ